MTLYIVKPMIVQAWQYEEGKELPDWLPASHLAFGAEGHKVVFVCDEWVKIKEGDWVIYHMFEKQLRFELVSKGDFEQRFEHVGEGSLISGNLKDEQ